MPGEPALRGIFAELETAARRRLAEWMPGDPAIRRSADMRYGEQVFEIGVPLDAVDWGGADLPSRLAEAFHRRHEALFTYAMHGEEVVLVTARVAAVGRLPGSPAPAPPDREAAAPLGPRRAVIGGREIALPVHGFERLTPDQCIAGPAIVESDTTTVLLLPGDLARLDARGWLEVELPA
jgi:N-methylhydantoinase A